MRPVGVLERELVQVEALADVAQLLDRRLEQPEPDEVAVADDAARGDVERELALVLADAVAIVRAIDDHALGFSLGAVPPATVRGRAPGRGPRSALARATAECAGVYEAG